MLFFFGKEGKRGLCNKMGFREFKLVDWKKFVPPKLGRIKTLGRQMDESVDPHWTVAGFWSERDKLGLKKGEDWGVPLFFSNLKNPINGANFKPLGYF